MQGARRVLVTGATSGIGLAAARRLAPTAERLVLHGPEPAEEVAPLLDDIAARVGPGGSVAYLPADYGRLADVARFAEEVMTAAAPLDLVVNNAAIAGPPTRTESADGNELTLQVDYLAPVLLTERVLAAHDPGAATLRIVNVASATHLSARLALDDLDLHHGYSPVAAYARSKLALVTYTCWLARELAEGSAEVVAVHPGVVSTGLLHAMFDVRGERPEAAGQVLADVARRSGDSGTYYDEDRPAEPSPVARDPAVQRRLRELTAEKLAHAGHAGTEVAR